MANESDAYTFQEFETYLHKMEQAGRDWLRERLPDDEFMNLYHTRFYRCVQLMEDDQDIPTPANVAQRSEELLEHFRRLRKLLDSIEFSIRDYRKYGFSEVDLLQKVAVLGRCLTEVNFEYRPLRGGRPDPDPLPRPSPG